LSDKPEDAAADLLIKEVDEELRQEQLNKIWKKYANLLVAGAVAIVLGVAGWQAWRAWDGKQRLASSERFSEAARLIEQGKLDEAQPILAKLALNGAGGYRVLAAMKQASLREMTGDRDGATALYRGIAESRDADATYRSLALLKASYLDLDTGDLALIEKAVEPLALESSPWRHSAREILALAALKKGERAKAIEMFKKLADDVAAPQGMRSRAAEMLAAEQPKAKG